MPRRRTRSGQDGHKHGFARDKRVPRIWRRRSVSALVFAGPRGHKFAITRREQRTARRPPNAPETVAAEKNSAARIPNSDRLYQLQRARGRAHAISHEFQSRSKGRG